MANQWIVIGTVTSVNPAKRVLRVEAVAQYAHHFDGMATARIALRDGTAKSVRVTGTRETEQAILMTLAPGVTRDTVAALRGAEVTIGRDELRQRPDGLYVAEDFPGMTVVGDGGAPVGTVVDAFATPANFVIEVETQNGETILVPVVNAVVTEIDLRARQLTVLDLSAFAGQDPVDED